MTEKIYDTAIIGGGPGGYTAALYLSRAGLSCIVLEKLSPGGQMASTGTVDNYPGFHEGIDGFELGERMQSGAERFGAESAFTTVEKASLSGRIKELSTDSGIIKARTVVIATGASPRLAGVPGEREFTGKGVTYCAACDGAFYKNKTVAVIGGGNSAAADALLLLKLAKKVYLVHRRDALRASKIYADALKKSAVEFVWNSTPEEIKGSEKVASLVVNSAGGKREIAVDGVFVAIGRIPDTGLFKGQIKLDEQGYIIAGEDTKTDIPGVFAVGDVRTKPMRQIITAASDGATASHFIEEYLSSTEF